LVFVILIKKDNVLTIDSLFDNELQSNFVQDYKEEGCGGVQA